MQNGAPPHFMLYISEWP